MVKRWIPLLFLVILGGSLFITKDPSKSLMDHSLIRGNSEKNELQLDRVKLAGVPLIENLEQELSKLKAPGDNMTEWLASVVAGYDSRNEPIHLMQTDFDQDGVLDDWVTVLSEEIRDGQSGEIEYSLSHGIVIAYKDGKFILDSLLLPHEGFVKANVEAIEDLTGDGRPEVVWASHNRSAHTTYTTYIISTWSEGKLETLKGSAEIASVSRTEIAGGKLLLTGGLIDSVGAGTWQREYTDTYTIVNGTIQRTDRIFAESLTPYHRLMDGLWAEAYGHSERALQDYTEASEMKRSSYKEYNFVYDGERVEGGINTNQEQAFEHTVNQFALLRKELLSSKLKGSSTEAACTSAKKATAYDEAWLTQLNAPYGYANPIWETDTICSNINEVMQ